jgi:hypothetical protein
VKPATDHRLSDHISWGLLARVFPAELVDQAVRDSRRVQQRSRLLPSRTVVYYVMGLALFSQSSYEEVMATLLAGQAWSSGVAESPPVPTKAALFKARSRLGPEPLQRLFEQVARPLAGEGEAGAFYRGRRLMSIDSADLDVPETPANAEAFGRPEAGAGAHLLPQVRVVGLSATATRSIVDARVGGVQDAVQHLASGILETLPTNALLLAGRAFFSPASWSKAAATGADLLWRVPSDRDLPVGQRHDDGSYGSRIQLDGSRDRSIDVRVIERQVGDDVVQRIVTTITDPSRAPADELGRLYLDRWEIASAFDELKAHHLRPRMVLRSKVPDGVRQEVYGYLCVHFAVRWLMHGVQGLPSLPTRDDGK